jgi:ferric enterobactin receptor
MDIKGQMNLKLFTLLCLLICAFETAAQKHSFIKGSILRKDNRQPLAGAAILVVENGIGTTADSAGRFSFSVPNGSHLFEITHQGFFKKYTKIDIRKETILEILLDEKVNELEEVQVSASSAAANVNRLGTGITSLNARSLKKLPTLLGEVDIIKSLYTLPGVTSVGEGASGFNVRGGNVDQNLILLDDAPIFNSSHLMGFFSVFNPDAFRDYQFYRGGVPAQYGGRIASVLAVSMKDANAQKLSVNGGIGTISSRLMIETPIVKEKASLYVAGRISYIDALLKKVKIKKLEGSKANFYDITAKLEIRPNTKDRLSFSYFDGLDRFKLAKDTISAIDDNGNALYTWQSRNLASSWAHAFSNKLSTKIGVVWAKYNANVDNADTLTAFNMAYGIDYKSAKIIAAYNVTDQHEIELGFQTNWYQMQPGSLMPSNPLSNKNHIKLANEYGNENAMFVSDKLKLSNKLDLSIGLRMVQYNALGASTVYKYEKGKPINTTNITDSTSYNKGQRIQTYNSLEPRISVNFAVSASAAIKLSANRMRQFLQLLSSTTAALPTDRWKLADSHIRPQLSDQVSIGYFKNFSDKAAEGSVELFYKKLSDVVDYKDGETLLLNKFPETAILQGNGYSYGLELYLKKNLGVLTGWLSYTYSQTRLRVAGPSEEETINNGQYFPPIFNRPHSFNAIASYQVSKKVSFNGNLNYSSGRAITYPSSKFFLSGASIPYYNSRNANRIPDYFRIDASMNIESHPYRTTGYRGNWNLSLYNIFARRNAYSVFFRARNPYNQFFSRVPIYKLSVLGSIIPSISYNFKL